MKWGEMTQEQEEDRIRQLLDVKRREHLRASPIEQVRFHLENNPNPVLRELARQELEVREIEATIIGATNVV